MKILLLTDFVLVMGVAFFDWLFPRAGQKTREIFEEWWIKFSDLDHREIGSFVAGILTRRMDDSLGSSQLSKRFVVVSFVLSQVIFLFILVCVAIAWGVISAVAFRTSISQFVSIVLELRYYIVPLVVLNTVFNLLSLGITRKILRKASKAKNPITFAKLILIDFVIAAFLVLFSAFFFLLMYSPFRRLGGIVALLKLLGVIIGWAGATMYATMYLLLVLLSWKELRQDFTAWYERSVSVQSIEMVIPIIPNAVVQNILHFLSFIFFGAVAIYFIIKGLHNIVRLFVGLSELSAIFVLAVSLTAIIPSMLNLLLLILMFVARLVSRPAHAIVSHLLLRLAETKRGILYLLVILLAAGKDLLIILLI